MGVSFHFFDAKHVWIVVCYLYYIYKENSPFREDFGLTFLLFQLYPQTIILIIMLYFSCY